MRGQKGGAYLFVMIVMLVLFLMVAVLLNLTGYEIRVTNEQDEYAMLYELAVSGAEKECHCLSQELSRFGGDISQEDAFLAGYQLSHTDTIWIDSSRHYRIESQINWNKNQVTSAAYNASTNPERYIYVTAAITWASPERVLVLNKIRKAVK